MSVRAPGRPSSRRQGGKAARRRMAVGPGGGGRLGVGQAGHARHGGSEAAPAGRVGGAMRPAGCGSSGRDSGGFGRRARHTATAVTAPLGSEAAVGPVRRRAVGRGGGGGQSRIIYLWAHGWTEQRPAGAGRRERPVVAAVRCWRPPLPPNPPPRRLRHPSPPLLPSPPCLRIPSEYALASGCTG